MRDTVFSVLFVALVCLVAFCASGCAHAPCRCTCEIKVPAAAHVHDVEPGRGEAVADVFCIDDRGCPSFEPGLYFNQEEITD